VTYGPDYGNRKKYVPVYLRHLAIRVLRKQGSHFADGSDRKHFCIVTNRGGNGLDLIRWHRKKAGSIEHVHKVLTYDLAPEALPSQKFGEMPRGCGSTSSPTTSPRRSSAWACPRTFTPLSPSTSASCC
jgi:hypothetical protein